MTNAGAILMIANRDFLKLLRDRALSRLLGEDWPARAEESG